MDAISLGEPSGSTVHVNGVDLHVEVTGTGPEAIVFSHGLLFSARMFDAQVAAFGSRYRCIAYDHRGQGRSQRVRERRIDIDTHYQDAVALIETLHVAPCHFVGLSMGGFVGMRLAARRPDLVRSLTLLETTADPEPCLSRLRSAVLTLIIRIFGVRPVVGTAMKMFFGPTFLGDPQRADEGAAWRAHLEATLDRSILATIKGVVTRKSIVAELGRITAPVLIIVGEEDRLTEPSRAERIHRAIAGSRLVRVPAAGHSSTIERPDAVNTAIDEFLRQ